MQIDRLLLVIMTDMVLLLFFVLFEDSQIGLEHLSTTSVGAGEQGTKRGRGKASATDTPAPLTGFGPDPDPAPMTRNSWSRPGSKNSATDTLLKSPVSTLRTASTCVCGV
jgi:hypothetical protein